MCALSSRLLQQTQRLLSRFCQVSIRVLVVSLTAILLNFVLPESAQAATLDWQSPDIEWSSGTAPGASQIFPNTGTVGNSGVRVRLSLSGDSIGVDVGDPPPVTGLNGGSVPESTLLILINAALRSQAFQLRFDYLDPAGAPVPVENARFVIVDIDSNNGVAGTGGVWQDEVVAQGQVFAGGGAAPTLFAWPTTIVGVDPSFDGLLQPAGGIFPLTTAANYTVQTPIIGNTATAIRLRDANNDTPNGSVLAAYGDTIESATFTYRSGAGADNNPGQQGIGLYNVFFDPVMIGTSKQVTNVVDNANGTYTITYQVVVENMGGVELRNVQLTEDLSTTFTAPTTFNVTDVRLIGTTRAGAPAPNINAGFTGVAPNTNLLDGVGSLLPRVLDLNNTQTAAGGTVTVQFDVLVTPNGNLGPFNNQVQASGTSPNGQTVTDDSVNGADPDPNGDGSASESSPTIVTLVPADANLQLIKRITAVFRGGAELVRYNTFTDQPGTTIDNSLNAATTGAAANEPVGVFQLPNTVSLQSGDQLEYSIYYWNPSAITNSTNISLCDEVQPPVTLDTTSLQRSNPIVNPTSSALTYAAAASVVSRAAGDPLDAYCLSAPGTFPAGGGVIVPGPFDINAAAPSGQYGAFRFRVTVP